MQPIAAGVELAAYHARLLGSHDFTMTVEVLNLDEQPLGTVNFLDGQVNIARDNLVRRTCNLTVSDPDGALDFSDDASWDGVSLWADRLLRVRHTIEVPGYGEKTATAFIGPVATLGQQGPEVSVTCNDKGALANRGALPLTVPKGMSAITAIRQIMAKRTGEFRFRLPASRRRLSKAYSVGLDDESSPLAVATRIARAELDMQLIYSCDGYLTVRRTPEMDAPVIDLGLVTDVPSTASDFTTAVNYARVTGATKSKTKKRRTTETTPQSTAELKPSASLSSRRLQRKGVERILPVVLEESSLTTTKQTAARAENELRKGSRVGGEIGLSVIPVFHLDVDDVVRVRNADNETRTARLETASIPLGVGGEMTVGFQRVVSSGKSGRPRSRLIKKVKVEKKPGKKGDSKGRGKGRGRGK